MSGKKNSSLADRYLTRRQFLKAGALGFGGAVAAACGATPTPVERVVTSEPEVVERVVTSEPEIVERVVTGTPPPALEEVITRLLWIHNVEFGGFWAAMDKGYYAEEGIDAKFLPGGPGIQVETIVAAGGEPIGVTGNAVTFIKAVAGGANLKCFGAVFQKTPAGLLSLPENPILSVEDAIGKRIGLQPGAINAWNTILAVHGVSADEMEIVPVSFDPSPLVAGQVDGFWCYVPNQPLMLKAQGFEPVTVLAYDLGFKYYGNFIIARQPTIDQRRDMLVRWTRASQRGWEYNNANPEEAAQITVEKISPDLNLNLEEQIGENLAQIPFTESDLTKEKGLFWMDPAVWEEGVQLMVDLGELDEPIEVDRLITLDILEEASA